MDSPMASGDLSVNGNVYATNVINGIQYNLKMIFQQPFHPPPDLRQLRADYLSYLRDSYRYLDMKGVRQVQQVTQQLALTAVYVPLKAHAGPATNAGRVAGRPWATMEESARDTLAAMEPLRHAEPVPVERALHADPAVVVLGDPGAGKSTLLKVLALAQQDQGPASVDALFSTACSVTQTCSWNVARGNTAFYI